MITIEKRKISLISPFYNEEKGVQAFFQRINEVFAPLAERYDLEVIAINDGSRDRTYEELVRAKAVNDYLTVVDLSRNFGKEAAISAGLDFATGDAVIPIDSDLQHPPEVILELIEKWEEGAEVVLAKRVDRETDRAIQKFTANSFYKLHNRISDIDIPADVGDFRLMDRKVVEALKTLPETRRFMKGLFAWVGFRTTTIEYKVAPREHGTTSFNTWKLWNFALEGITSFSSAPLRVWTYLGCAVSAFSFLYAAYLLIKTIFFGIDTPGYASIMITVLFASGVQLIGIGVLGEYVGRIFAESKKRPVYIVRDVIK
ncbi:glycosyltransferase family 2 protein [Pseudomonas alliivorans]|uniref:glycosyltransferase family 2 protein n=1 Tax=Pseudomonas alliivorans TaxID=2810613 RepID=UPI001F3A8F94|nr:glycosyltransferase family 2 protein [Pseudomonas alliivorans]MEE4876713.1 glycosyltransferase family 2 protein [Pseudomonas alliivorans]MEE4929176.1 glycosyltransferase family 2 protein [Pseudomonas alliivorans]MEE4934591.1 glycosyltransferase family 2 protein [Pseudomonas alliivorans]MEE4939723.1 glycosyltransferase family 2 protein [Pseudomonas alliivorans]MEE4949582.1 glycosyltransferase family 2 protein [Pseudomonas alliivorans]